MAIGCRWLLFAAADIGHEITVLEQEGGEGDDRPGRQLVGGAKRRSEKKCNAVVLMFK